MSSSVAAVCDISEGTCSLPGVELRGGYLNIVEKQVCQNWACLIAIAKDCHEQNVELTKSPCGFILRMTRAVKACEELFIWMGADLLSQLEFPFLTPINIKGNQAYHCHKCGRIFQNPNPLKVHLFFQCQAPAVHFLEYPDSPREISHHLEEAPSLENAGSSKCFGMSYSKVSQPNNPTLPLLILPKFYSRDKEMSSLVGLPNSRKLQALNSLSALNHTESFCKDNLTFELRLSQESTSSNSMWIGHTSDYPSSSPGHVCGYCGKVYSRKYGLKIHVRTHTGYKPLKCRYCFRPFSDPSNLNKHIRLHSESDTPYRCTICGKILVRRRDLQRHINSRHPGEKIDSIDDIKKQNIFKKVQEISEKIK
ncbi:unnamed protein product [Larinioides sclopetarius]|uniref:C2H2-type domain-containing protein n=1 Tax=Larinioides sclopetarius TaxID=280406 RepID=A0AAV2AYB7_9ARAC